MLSSNFQSNPALIGEMHLGGSQKLDSMFKALNETGSLTNFINAIEQNAHEFTGKLQDTKMLVGEDIANSKALHTALIELLAKGSAEAEIDQISAAFSAINDIEKNSGISFDGFEENVSEEKILSSDNSVLKVVYESITKDPEYLRVKTDKFLSDNERQEKIAEITVGYLNPSTLNFSILEMADRMRSIQEVHKNPTDVDLLMAEVGKLRSNIAFLNQLNSGKSNDALFENIEDTNRAVTQLANNTVDETRSVDKAFAYDYDKGLKEAVENNREVVVGAPEESTEQNKGLKTGL